jgi:zinc D-Ala-D-Ala carboxypeptidase
VTRHPIRPLHSPHPGKQLAAAVLVVVLLAFAIAAFHHGDTEREPAGLAQVRSADDPSAMGEPDVPFDGGRPTVDNLDPDLLDAVRAAARDALDDGVELSITSGWRSRAHQQQLFDEAVDTYGSEEEARRYVSTPDTSAHVTGDAVDIGPTDADDWLGRHGADYGLCQMFANEIWHFELATTPGGECPEMLPDSSYRG